MNPESLKNRLCDECDTRIEWGSVHTDATHYYHRYGRCLCIDRRWYTERFGSGWTDHSYREGGGDTV
jgi:hypothetical protein